MSDEQKINVLRGAVLGLLGQAEEQGEDLGPCDHAKGICRCRLDERMREARAALELTQ